MPRNIESRVGRQNSVTTSPVLNWIAPSGPPAIIPAPQKKTGRMRTRIWMGGYRQLNQRNRGQSRRNLKQGNMMVLELDETNGTLSSTY